MGLLLRGPGDAGMTEILLGVLTEHLAFVTANGAFDNNFGAGSRRSVHVGWSHRFQATRLEALLQDESTLRRYLKAFRGEKPAAGMISHHRHNFLGFHRGSVVH